MISNLERFATALPTERIALVGIDSVEASEAGYVLEQAVSGSSDVKWQTEWMY